MNSSIFCKIPGFDNYMISPEGELLSLSRKNNQGEMSNIQRIMKWATTGKYYKNGRPYLGTYILSNSGKRVSVKAHRLVAKVFCENKDNKKYVNHKDGNTTNNSYLNLEWVTASENQKHAYSTGLKKYYKERKFSKENIIEIRKLIEDSKISLSKIAQKFNGTIGDIVAIKDNVTYQDF